MHQPGRRWRARFGRGRTRAAPAPPPDLVPMHHHPMRAASAGPPRCHPRHAFTESAPRRAPRGSARQRTEESMAPPGLRGSARPAGRLTAGPARAPRRALGQRKCHEAGRRGGGPSTPGNAAIFRSAREPRGAASAGPHAVTRHVDTGGPGSELGGIGPPGRRPRTSYVRVSSPPPPPHPHRQPAPCVRRRRVRAGLRRAARRGQPGRRCRRPFVGRRLRSHGVHVLKPAPPALLGTVPSSAGVCRAAPPPGIHVPL
jgi:hypothetical protein